MQYDLSTLTPATRAVLDALIAFGQGDVHQLSERSGKARSTTDRAVKTLADAGLIIAVDTGTDSDESAPTRWTLSEGIAAEAQDHDFSTDAELGDNDGDPAGNGDYPDTTETDGLETDLAGEDPTETANSDGSGDEAQPGNEPGDDHAAPEVTEDAEAYSGDTEDHDTDQDAADTDVLDGSDGDGDANEAECDVDESESESDDENTGEIEGDTSRVSVVQPSRPGDRKIMTIKAVLSEYGDDGATIGEIVAESGIGEATVSRLMTAMEQADAARRRPGIPARWIAGPTKASEVDPNPEPPRCPLCFQVIKGMSGSPEAVAQVQPLIRPDGTLHIVTSDGAVHAVLLPRRLPIRTQEYPIAGVRRTDGTVNADGNQPFAKGELERLTLETLIANPGRTMTPQEIAAAISDQLGGRAVSSGAVRNNCGKLGAAGRIVMVSESPWAFQYPMPEPTDSADRSDDATATPAGTEPGQR